MAWDVCGIFVRNICTLKAEWFQDPPVVDTCVNQGASAESLMLIRRNGKIRVRLIGIKNDELLLQMMSETTYKATDLTVDS